MASLFRLLVALMLVILAACGQFGKTPPAVEPWYPAVNDAGDPVFAVFESRIPCADCEKIKFALALYRDRETKAPTTYKLARVYVARSPEERVINEGNWTIRRGTRLNAQAIVYRLDANAPAEFRWYWAIGQDILFILDQDLNPRVGTAGYGYALNKIR